MSAKQVALNWTKILSNCTPAVRKTILETRSHHEDLRRQITELKHSMPKLDFAAYKAELPKEMVKMVEEAEGQIKNYKPKEINVSDSIKALEEERKIKVTKASQLKLSQEFVINLETQVDKLKSQLNKLETAKAVDELTVADVYEMNPELRDQVHQLIKDDHWAVYEEEQGGNKKKEEETTGNELNNQKEKLNYL